MMKLKIFLSIFIVIASSENVKLRSYIDNFFENNNYSDPMTKDLTKQCTYKVLNLNSHRKDYKIDSKNAEFSLIASSFLCSKKPTLHKMFDKSLENIIALDLNPKNISMECINWKVTLSSNYKLFKYLSEEDCDNQVLQFDKWINTEMDSTKEKVNFPICDQYLFENFQLEPYFMVAISKKQLTQEQILLLKESYAHEKHHLGQKTIDCILKKLNKSN